MPAFSSSLFSLHRLTFSHPGLAAQLIDFYGSAESVLAAFDERLTPVSAGLSHKLRVIAHSKEHLTSVDQDTSWANETNHSVLRLGDENYPVLLSEISDPPLLLFVWGDPKFLLQDQLALVGSRKASPDGISIAEQLSSELVASGFVITSGMALGIDAAAHRGALKVGGQTIAVQGVGAGAIYPRRHERLALKIVESGCLLSEYPTSIDARAHQFPQRNRIVTGLTKGTIVVEASEASGSLISARLAMEQGREVFAVPGSVRTKHSDGCHRLIKQGAKLVTNLADVLEEFNDFELKRHRRVRNFSEQERPVVEALQHGSCHADKLHEQTGIEIHHLMAVLMALEIRGEIQSDHNGYRMTDEL